MSEQIELNPASHITIGTVGEPGNRTFYLQGSQRETVISLIIEKTQASMIAEAIEGLMKDVATDHPELAPLESEFATIDVRLRDPAVALFRVGNLGLGFNQESGRIIIAAYEMVEEGVDPGLVSFWGTFDQMRALIKQTRTLVKSGRPICGNCGVSMDKDGHFCPRRNGHNH
ncbi:MAG: putative repeat protein (TIGR03847 family) [Cellvibrionaceae bacterium]|jgi:uncharacterized repeat protein (TIGR03847 family)